MQVMTASANGHQQGTDAAWSVRYRWWLRYNKLCRNFHAVQPAGAGMNGCTSLCATDLHCTPKMARGNARG
jgi:hypothetical protein